MRNDRGGWSRLCRGIVAVLLLYPGIATLQAQHAASRPAPLTIDTTNEIVRAMYSDFDVPPDGDVTLGSPIPSKFGGFDDIPITVKIANQIQKVHLLISLDRQTVVRYDMLNLTNDDPLMGISISRTVGWGNPAAPVQIVAFMDLQCPYCAAMHRQFVTSTLEHYKDKVWITYKPFPLESHDKALLLAKQAECLANHSPDAYKRYIGDLYAAQSDNSKVDVDSEAANIVKEMHLDSAQIAACVSDPKTGLRVLQSTKDGIRAGVVATPTYFVNGERIKGALKETALWKVIDRAEAQANARNNEKSTVSISSSSPQGH